MTDFPGLYRYKALLMPWAVRGIDTWTATGTAWWDGDTCAVLVSRGEHDYLLTHLRCAGYNAPELRDAGGRAAVDFVRTLADTGDTIYLDSHSFGTDQEDNFGRMLATVTLADGRDLATLMIDSGHAVVDNG